MEEFRKSTPSWELVAAVLHRGNIEPWFKDTWLYHRAEWCCSNVSWQQYCKIYNLAHMSEQPKSTVGKPIYVETLLTPEEYRQCALKYPNTYQSNQPREVFDCEYKWRWRMGQSPTTQEIELSNTRMEALKRKHNLT